MSSIAVITDNAVGGTFITWSILWLSGESKYFCVAKNYDVTLVSNPLTDKNSHKFVANQAFELSDIKNILSCLPQNNNLHHLYFHILRPVNKDYSRKNDIDTTHQGIELVKKNSDKIIVVNNHKEYALYKCSISRRSKARSMNGQRLISDDNEALQDFLKHFFQKSLNSWQHLTEIWDQREFLALNVDPYQNLYIKDCHEFDFDFYDLPAHAGWLSLDTYIKEILNYCNLQLNQSRFDQWIPIYNQWKNFHHNRIKFCWFFDTIINNIVVGRDMDLQNFDLDILQEAAIQRELIYKHNLNFKTYQLRKFLNTQQLHNLLETNIHPLSS